MNDQPETALEQIIDDMYNCREITLRLGERYGRWHASFTYDGCGFTGEGDTPEEALIQGVVERHISDMVLAGPMDLDIPLATMTGIMEAAYQKYLGRAAGFEYAGYSARKAAK